MGHGTTVFLSSTIADLADVRAALRRKLEEFGFDVLTSERPDYPVEPGLSSHDACLAAVRRSNIFILLIGGRFGGSYKDQYKSVTWREWEEARACGLHPIVLIRKDINDLAIRIAKARAAMRTANSAQLLSEVDRDLAASDPAFADVKPRVQGLPAVQRFIDSVRKGHVDNWVHLEWDGSIDEALKIIGPRLSSTFAAYQRNTAQMADRARRQYLSLNALLEITKAQADLVRRRVAGLSRDEGVQGLLELIRSYRAELLGFREGDVYSFIVHYRNGDSMLPGSAVLHKDIPTDRPSRSWKAGVGHVGRSLARNSMLVVPDLPESDGWVHGADADSDANDRACYASVVTVPLYFKGNKKELDATFTVTSSRRHQFEDLDQSECLTSACLGSMLSGVIGASI